MASFTDDDLNTLEAFAAQLERCADLEAACWAVQTPIEHFEFPDCVLYVREGNLLAQMSATGPKRLEGSRIAQRIGLSIGQGIAGEVARTGTAAYIPDVSQDSRYVFDVMFGRAEIALPVEFRGEVIAVLDCEHPELDGFSARQRHLLGAVADILSPHLGALLERRSFRGAHVFGEVAAELAKLPAIATGELEAAMPQITERAARTLRASRVNVWRVNSTPEELVCLDHYDLSSNQHRLLKSVDMSDLKAYAQALRDERVLIANEAMEDVRTSELTPSYLVPNQITAMLDAPIRVSGELVGVLCVEHTKTARVWSIEEASFVATLSDFVALTFLAAEKARAERQLMHAQKLESLGRLAGGIAHDFNNLLTVLVGGVDALLMSATLSQEDRALVESIGSVGTRAGVLTRQLLALGRQQQLDFQVTDVRQLVEDTLQLLRSALPPNIELTACDLESANVRCDAPQLSQVLTNLVLNAADAMPSGGQLQVSSSRAEVDGIAEAWVRVEDNGDGIAPENLEAVFEPFFTTKGEAGSGLGLAVSLGIVHQHGGRIELESQLGEGSAFTIKLPLAVAGVHRRPSDSVKELDVLTDAGPVVLIEDEPGVRQVVIQMLALLNVEACVAENAEQALQIVSEVKPSMMISDVVMPDRNGPDLFAQARQIVPDLRVLFISGYSRELLGDLQFPHECYAFLGKPFTVKSLGEAMTQLRSATAQSGAVQAR